MEFLEIIGILAAVLTTFSFLPQAIKTIKSSNTKALSLPMYMSFVLGVFLWVVYGYHTNQTHLLLGNLITLFLAGTILFVKIKNMKKNEE